MAFEIDVIFGNCRLLLKAMAIGGWWWMMENRKRFLVLVIIMTVAGKCLIARV
jgi:hypothetical protein